MCLHVAFYYFYGILSENITKNFMNNKEDKCTDNVAETTSAAAVNFQALSLIMY